VITSCTTVIMMPQLWQIYSDSYNIIHDQLPKGHNTQGQLMYKLIFVTRRRYLISCNYLITDITKQS